MILVRQLPIDPMKGTWYYFLDGDPTSGFAAAVDSLVLRVDSTGLGRVYKKTGAPDSGWTEITGGGSGSTPVATTVLTGTVEVDDNGAGAPVALTTTGHLLAADPHPQYALDSEKGAASGLATLDGSSLLTASQLPLGSSATTAAAGNDARLSDSRTPTAHGLNSAAGFHTASGLTTGWVLRATGATTFAMAALQASDIPTIAESQVTNLTTDLAARVLTSDARLSDSRTPTAHATTHQPGGTDAMAVDAVAATGSLRTLGSGAQQATSGTDARLSNARTPLAHATTHSSGGTDPVTVTNLAGYPGGTTSFLRADGSFAAPTAAASPVESYDVGTQSLATEQFILQYQHLKLSSTERLTLSGTSEMYVSDFAAYSPAPSPFATPATIDRPQTVSTTQRVVLQGPQTIAPGTSVTVQSGGVMQILPNPYGATFSGSGTNHTAGVVPDPGPISGSTRFLCEDGTWSDTGLNTGSWYPGSLSMTRENFLVQYQHLKLTGSQRATIGGTAEVFITDFGAYATTILGKPKSPNVSFTVPADYYLDIFTRLTMQKTQRATLAGTADLILTDDFGTRSRITLAGRG